MLRSRFHDDDGIVDDDADASTRPNKDRAFNPKPNNA